jgi:hypothetical protein
MTEKISSRRINMKKVHLIDVFPNAKRATSLEKKN